MSYPTIFRERTIEYRQSGHTLKETSEAFKVSISAIAEWEQKLKESGSLEKKALNRPHKKIDPEKLRAYIEEHPDAYQREMAEEFDCSVTADTKSIETLRDYTKKRQHATRNKISNK